MSNIQHFLKTRALLEKHPADAAEIISQSDFEAWAFKPLATNILNFDSLDGAVRVLKYMGKLEIAQQIEELLDEMRKVLEFDGIVM